MKVIIDGFWLVSGPPSGRMVVRETIRAWKQIHPEDHLSVLVPRREQARVRRDHPDVEVLGTRAPLHPIAAAVALPLVARRSNADLVLSQNFAPLLKGTRSAVFVHDVLFQSNPGWFTRSERVYLSLIPALLSRADRVLTSSSTEAHRIRQHNPRLGDVVPTGLGISSAMLTDSPSRAVEDLTPGRFLLTVGRLNVRKNLSTTIEAAVASGRISREHPLVVVGEPSGRSEALSVKVREAEAAGTVRFLGGVPDEQLRWLYEHCRLMLFLSRDEGWGLPPIEAANLGARVLVSDRPIFRETLEGVAAFVKSDDVEAVAEGVRGELDENRPRLHRTDTTRPLFSWAGMISAARAVTEK